MERHKRLDVEDFRRVGLAELRNKLPGADAAGRYGLHGDARKLKGVREILAAALDEPRTIPMIEALRAIREIVQ